MSKPCRYCAPARHEEVDVPALLEHAARAGRYGSVEAAAQALRGYYETQDPQTDLPLEMSMDEPQQGPTEVLQRLAGDLRELAGASR